MEPIQPKYNRFFSSVPLEVSCHADSFNFIVQILSPHSSTMYYICGIQSIEKLYLNHLAAMSLSRHSAPISPHNPQDTLYSFQETISLIESCDFPSHV